MKAITLKEAKQFDREADAQRYKDVMMNTAIKWFNHILELVYPKLSSEEWHDHYSYPITEFATMRKELKEMYNKNGFDFEWEAPFIRFKIKLLNESNN